MENIEKSPPAPRSVGVNRYRLGRRIGCGSFGQIYIGTHISSNEDIAIKLEPLRARHPQLLYEAKIYKMLGGQPGIPGIYWWGHEGEWTCIVIELLGPSLEDLFTQCRRHFSLKTVLMVGEQMLTRIQMLHEHSYLHRDIKPDNFLVGTARGPSRFRRPPPACEDLPSSAVNSTWAAPAPNSSSVVYMLDFGLCKRYRDARTLEHIPYRTGKSLTGTARYASLATHLGMEQARRDDLESLAYVMIYFLRGALPWQGLHADTKQDKYTKIMQNKQRTTVENLTRSLPGSNELRQFLAHIRCLRFEEEPDYNFLRGLLKNLFERQQLKWDHRLDWNSLSESQLQNLWHDMAPNATNTNILRPSCLVPFIPHTSPGIPTGTTINPHTGEPIENVNPGNVLGLDVRNAGTAPLPLSKGKSSELV
eukprot:GDKJ01015930.1.p1 GENE.GDKJ01015930.1~~GDKJ01015930.1.p1  ORF type:complete len:420 (+),score=82.91 GDKJ01015930.1:125-1384(+)